MSSVGDVDLIGQLEYRFACPFIKARPQQWMHRSECLVYANPELRRTVIRHHVIATHEAINKKLSADSPYYMDPDIWYDLKQWLKSPHGKTSTPEEVWKYVYNRIGTASGQQPSKHEHPYWSLQWLREMLISVLPSDGNAETSRGQSSERTSFDQASLESARIGEGLQAVRRLVSKHIAESSNIVDQLQILEHKNQMLGRVRSLAPLVHSSHPASHEATNNTGTLFSDQPFASPALFPDRMIDTSLSDDHLDPNLKEAFGTNDYRFLQNENCAWDSPEFSHGLDQVANSANTYLTLTEPPIATDETLLSGNTTSINTPPSSVCYGPL